MRILAIETSQRQASVSALDAQGSVLHSLTLSPEQRTAQALHPAIRELLATCGWQPDKLDLICASTGPGSFTGLRMGVTTAKTFAYATGAKLVGVHTLAAMAYRNKATSGRLWTILDAQRSELFAACFIKNQPFETQVISIDHWLDLLKPGDTVSGPPLKKISARMPPDVHITPAESWSPRSEEVGQLGLAAFLQGKVTEPVQFIPKYFRRSAAEEKAGI